MQRCIVSGSAFAGPFSRFRRAFALAVATTSLLVLAAQAAPGAEQLVSIIVGSDASESVAADAVERFGGTITRRLGIVRGVSARVPSSAVTTLQRSEGKVLQNRTA